MTLSEFIDKYTGKLVDFDKVYGSQCMDLMHQYINDVLELVNGKILAAPAAKDVYEKFNTMFGNEYFDKIDNTPTGIPSKGDIVLFGSKVGLYGHVCIFIEGNESEFTSFDENWPIGSPCHIQKHDYVGCLGWLHLKLSANKTYTEAEYTAAMLDRQKFWEERDKLQGQLTDLTLIYSAIAGLGVTTVDDLQKERKDYEDRIVGYTTELAQVRDRCAVLADTISKQDKEEATALTDGLAALREVEELRGALGEIKQAVGAPSQANPQTIIDHVEKLIGYVNSALSKAKKESSFKVGTLAPALDTQQSEPWWKVWLESLGLGVLFFGLFAVVVLQLTH